MPLPRFSPATLIRAQEAFDHPSWIFELKMDGFRALAYIDEGQCQLVSRKGNVYKSFVPLCSTLAGLARQAILDGEIACLDACGKPQFYELLRRRGDPIFYAFDVLWLDGEDMRTRPTLERKLILEELVRDRAGILYARHFARRGVDLFRREAHPGAVRFRANALDQGAQSQLFAAGRPARIVRAETNGSVERSC